MSSTGKWSLSSKKSKDKKDKSSKESAAQPKQRSGKNKASVNKRYSVPVPQHAPLATGISSRSAIDDIGVEYEDVDGYVKEKSSEKAAAQPKQRSGKTKASINKRYSVPVQQHAPLATGISGRSAIDDIGVEYEDVDGYVKEKSSEEAAAQPKQRSGKNKASVNKRYSVPVQQHAPLATGISSRSAIDDIGVEYEDMDSYVNDDVIVRQRLAGGQAEPLSAASGMSETHGNRSLVSEVGYKTKQIPAVTIHGAERLPRVFSSPWSVAYSPEGNVYLTDLERCQLLSFSSSGQHLLSFGSPGKGPGEFMKPRGIAVSKVGTIFVSDSDNARVQTFDPALKLIRVFGGPPLNKPYGLTVHMNQVFIADWASHKIHVLSVDGRYLYNFGEQGSAPGQLACPHDVAITKHGHIVVADTNNHRLQQFTLAGDYLGCIGKQGRGRVEFSQPNSVTVAPDGVIIVGDSLNYRIQILSPEGEYIHAFGTRGDDPGEFDQIVGVSVNPDGVIAVCDYYNNNIQLF